MTGLKRLNAALRGEKCDRIPIFCNLLDQGAKELGISLREYYANGERVAEGQLRLREKYGYDNLWSLFFVGKEAELLGCGRIRYYASGPPNVEDFVIREYEDIERLAVPPDPASHPAFQEIRKCLDILKREAGGKYPICAYVTASMALPALLMGMDKWLELLFMGPPSLRDELLAKCHEFFVKEMGAYRDAGVDVFVYSNPFGSTDCVPMKYFLEHSLPWIERDISAVGNSGVVYYCGTSRVSRVMETVLERTGIGAYYLSPLDDVAEAMRIAAGRALLCGVINDIRLIDWSREEIRREVKRIVAVGMDGGGRFMFGTGLMPYAIPERNIRIMLEAAREFGRSPAGGHP